MHAQEPALGRDGSGETGGQAVSKLDEIEALAKAATPGPWQRLLSDDSLFVEAQNDHACANVCRVTPVIPGSGLSWRQRDMANPSRHEADAVFIAAANPATVLAMVEVIRAAIRMREGGHGTDSEQADEFDAALAKLESKP
jgi:hypothetical protein